MAAEEEVVAVSARLPVKKRGALLKNHIRINGQLLQTNKKWNHLKAKQKAWIMETAKREYDHFVQERGKLPVHGSKQ